MKGKSEMCSTYLHTYLILLIIEEATDQYSEKVKVNDNKNKISTSYFCKFFSTLSKYNIPMAWLSIEE